MNFTSQIFLFGFFPICFAAYFVVELLENRACLSRMIQKFRFKDLIVIGMSFLFYMWACFDDVFWLCFYIVGVYGAGLWIQYLYHKGLYIPVFSVRNKEDSVCEKKIPLSVFPLFLTILAVLFFLIYFKYTGFLTKVWNWMFGSSWSVSTGLAPLGISFLTFSAISYLADISRGSAEAGSLIDCMLYLSFFPKIASGPIVLWKDFKPMIANRHTKLENIICGLNRIMIGFMKKLILADSFGACVHKIPLSDVDQISAWGGVFLYMLQIYYDFSAYSDLALGLSKLLGFQFSENFNFPYCSKSISEFWRRWHISLGAWFREYVYFPMGGSRKGLHRTLWNLAVVFALTGLWHGAAGNYILWGGIQGALVLMERVIQEKVRENRLQTSESGLASEKEKTKQRHPKILDGIKWLAVMGITMFSWQLFRFSSLGEVWRCVRILFGQLSFEDIYYTWRYYFDRQIITLAFMGAAGAVLFGNKRLQAMVQRCLATKLGFAVQEMLLLLLFVISILFMVNSTYHPFIYFQY